MLSRFSFFRPKGEPTRKARVPEKDVTRTLTPTVDEETAQAAGALLENRAFDKVLERLRAAAFAEFAASAEGIEGFNARERTRTTVAVVDKIREDIQAMADELKLHHRTARDAGRDW